MSGKTTAYDLDAEDAPELVPLEQCFVFFDGKLRANDNGRRRFGDRFRRAGFDIDRISTFDELDAALRGSFHIEMRDLEEAFERRAGSVNSLEHQAVRAQFRGDFEASRVLLEKSRRVRTSKLKLVRRKGRTP
jgi:hypothetical protein